MYFAHPLTSTLYFVQATLANAKRLKSEAHAIKRAKIAEVTKLERKVAKLEHEEKEEMEVDLEESESEDEEVPSTKVCKVEDMV